MAHVEQYLLITEGHSLVTTGWATGISRAFLEPSGHLTRDSILDNIRLCWLTGTRATAAIIGDHEVWHSSS